MTLLCDTGLAILLAVTIGYCARLSKRIRMLQDSRSELGQMITRFDQATERAMTSLAELQTVSKKITEALQIKIEKANFLADDLAFLIEKAAKLAPSKDAPKGKPQEPAKAQHTEQRPHFETQFASARPASPAPDQGYMPPPTPSNAPPGSPSAPSLSSIEAVLQRLAMPGGPPSSVPNMRTPSPAANTAARTGAERELLEALKSGR